MANALVSALFPGQGSQSPGMAKTLLAEFPWTKEIYEEASDAIGFDLKRLCTDGDAADLQLTENQQPAILTTSFAWFSVVKKNLGFSPASGAGHSLGEYSALLAAEAMTLPEAVRLVRVRGQLMQKAVPVGVGKMAALLGLTDENVEALCKAATEGVSSLVVPANYNAPSQVVIAGHAGAVDRAAEIASGAKPEFAHLKARKVIPLNVSAPFHCPLMAPVADSMVSHLKETRWKTRRFKVVHNLDAEARTEGDLVSLLRDQIDHPVLWTKCAGKLESLGSKLYVEMGPGKVLTGLVKRILKDARLFNLDSLEDYKSLETAWKEFA